MSSQAPEQMELQEARKAVLCLPFLPVPPKNGIHVNREPGIRKSVLASQHWGHICTPFIKKAKFLRPSSFVLSAITLHSHSQPSAFSYGSKGSGCERQSQPLSKGGATKSSQSLILPNVT